MNQTQTSSFSTSYATISISPELPSANLAHQLFRHRMRQDATKAKLHKIRMINSAKHKLSSHMRSITQNQINAKRELQKQDSNQKKMQLADRSNSKCLYRKPFRIQLSNISNFEQLRKDFNCSRSKLKGKCVKFQREVHKTYDYEDNVNREIRKGAFGDNFILY